MMPTTQALEQLRTDGYVILRDILPNPVLQDVYTALRTLLDQQAWAKGEFFGDHTKRVHNIVAKTRVADTLVAHPAVLELVRGVLGPPQVSIVNAIEIHPGETAQFLHQDDAVFPIARPHPQLIVNSMWAITEFTAANGATRLVPGSQDAAEIPEHPATVVAEMAPGSVLIWAGGLIHGGGANHAEGPRLGLNVNYNRPWLRQQENQYLAIPRELAATFSDDFLRLLGYDTHIDMYGLVDHRHPLSVLGRDAPAIASGGGGMRAEVTADSGEPETSAATRPGRRGRTARRG